MFFKSKRQQNLEDYRDITDDVEESDFVPYASLYDAETIVTKNGELLQIIRIDGVPDGAEVRQALREAIHRCIPSDTYALWFHTSMRCQRLVLNPSIPSPL
jgi:type IV secretion system protein VirB4